MDADEESPCPTCGCPHPNRDMSTAITSRVPAGVPEGGQFASGLSPETPIRLADPSHGGTFAFPPAFSTAQEVVQFWSTVDVPDEAVAKFQDGYEAARAAEINERMERWDSANPRPADKFRKADRAGWEAARDAHLAEVTGSFPGEFIRADHARPLLRISQMQRWAKTIPEDEKDRYRELTFMLPDGTVRSGNATGELYRFGRFGNIVDGVGVKAGDDGSRELLVGIQRSLNRLAGSTRATTHAVENLHEQVSQDQRDGY